MKVSSIYFDNLLGLNFIEGSQEDVVIKDITGETLKSIIDFIYSGEITVEERNFLEILDASLWMELKALQTRLINVGQNILNANNCIETLFLIASRPKFYEFASIACDMIRDNFHKFQREEIATIDETYYQRLLQSDRLSGTETEIFNGLVHWISINKSIGDTSIPVLLRLIRFDLVPMQVGYQLFTYMQSYMNLRLKSLEIVFRPTNRFLWNTI